MALKLISRDMSIPEIIKVLKEVDTEINTIQKKIDWVKETIEFITNELQERGDKNISS